jgi:hypothetical protein
VHSTTTHLPHERPGNVQAIACKYQRPLELPSEMFPFKKDTFMHAFYATNIKMSFSYLLLNKYSTNCAKNHGFCLKWDKIWKVKMHITFKNFTLN